MSALPPVTADEEEVKAWVRAAVASMDATPRVANWRFRALGSSYAEAVADAPRFGRVGLKIPVGEMRVLREVAASRGIGVETMVRRGFVTWLVAVAGVEAKDIPNLARGGMLV